MKAKFWAGSAAGLLLLGLTAAANATLIGDTVYAQHYFTTLSQPYGSAVTAVVADGTMDKMAVAPHHNMYSVNVDADDFQVLFPFNTATFTTASFNGLVLSSLNDSSGTPLQTVSITTNLLGWDASRLSFLDDTVMLNFQSLSFNSDSYLTATLDFGQPVPEPSTMLLLGIGFAGVAGRSFFRRKQSV